MTSDPFVSRHASPESQGDSKPGGLLSWGRLFRFLRRRRRKKKRELEPNVQLFLDEKTFEELLRDVDIRRPTVLDDYGATNPAEFFALATETFFEKPKAFKRKHPELYEQLRNFYRQDPRSRC